MSKLIKVNVSAKISWDVFLPESILFGETATDIRKLVKESIDSVIPKNLNVDIRKISFLPKSNKKILGVFTQEEVFQALSEKKAKFQVGGLVYNVNMKSHRYHVFKHNNTCVSCGLSISKIMLEQHPNDKNPHFNFYAIEDNTLVLMTIDHIHAKSKGGLNNYENYQVMCSICNNLKAEFPLNNEQVKSLRDVWLSAKNEKISRKETSKLIKKQRDLILENSNEIIR